ncbi:hypothetical protein [Glutamicibacter mishrai]|uniref:acyl-CoA-like ligand-binding transcription factor n=1 Tax=Glutamicibacter mishrai TaxID=1775880 RepID=UPI001FE8A84C|nr:hypothetical protein [Glutamicibacter mishrai]
MHRYFATKEDMVIGPFETNGPRVSDELIKRPADEPIMQSLHGAYAAMITRGPHRSRDRAAMRLLASTPSLRARNTEKHMVWAELLTPIVAERLEGSDSPLRASVLVQTSLSAFQLALMAWADDVQERTILELIDVAFGDFEAGRN